MDDKELYEILQKYANDTKGEKESAFKKLNEKPQEEVMHSHKKFKPKYAFAVAMCMIVIVLCIALPITLTDKPQDVVEPTYCESGEIVYKLEDSLSSVIDNYHINAYYPTFVTNTEDVTVGSILSKNDASLHGVKLSFVIEKDEELTFVDFIVIPKTHIIQTYEDYFSLQNKLKWKEYDIKFFNVYDEETLMNEMKIYFTDGKYDYFIAVESDEGIEPVDILDILYN